MITPVYFWLHNRIFRVKNYIPGFMFTWRIVERASAVGVFVCVRTFHPLIGCLHYGSDSSPFYFYSPAFIYGNCHGWLRRILFRAGWLARFFAGRRRISRCRFSFYEIKLFLTGTRFARCIYNEKARVTMHLWIGFVRTMVNCDRGLVHNHIRCWISNFSALNPILDY